MGVQLFGASFSSASRMRSSFMLLLSGSVDVRASYHYDLVPPTSKDFFELLS